MSQGDETVTDCTQALPPQRRPSHSATPTWLIAVLPILLVGFTTGCGDKSPRTPATVTTPPADPSPGVTTGPEVERNPIVNETADDDMPTDVIAGIEDPDGIFSRTIEDINNDSPLDNIHFVYDSADLSTEARRTLESHAEWLGRYHTVSIMIAGHCDERGTVEYNLALGERRAMSAFNYLASLGVDAARMRTISFGKEIPLDSSSNEQAWANNRRGHFEITDVGR